jgi:pimeloyl-ACP methyl ester carboxylesterase
MPLIIAFFAAIFAIFVAIWRWARRRALSFEDRNLDDLTPPGNLITVNGVRLHYIDRGRGDALILLHGLGESTFGWRHNMDALARSFRVVAVDLLGSGFSQRLADTDYSLGARAGHVFAMMDALGIASATVVGHSLGGLVAMHMAARDPSRVRRLVLINSAGPREAHRLGRTRYFRIVNPFYYAFVYHSPRMRKRLFRLLYYRGRVPDGIVDHYLEVARVEGHEQALARLVDAVGREPRLDLRQIRVPTLILWGEGDRLLPPRRGRALAKSMPDARFVLVREAGHQTQEEQPDVVNRAIVDFAQRGVYREEARV